MGQSSVGTTVHTGTTQQILSWQQRGTDLLLHTTGGILCLRPYQTGILHVSFGSKAKKLPGSSYAVTQEPATAYFQVREDENYIELSTTQFKASVHKKQGYLTFYNQAGRQLLSESPAIARASAVSDSITPSCHFRLSPNEALYGLGQYRDGHMNLRGIKRELIQYNTQAAIPVVYSTGGWGVFWNNPSRTIFEDTQTGMSFISDYGTTVDYYLFVGETLDKLVASYRSLTGTVPMLPDWALGFHQSRNRYHNHKEVLQTVERMNHEQIPLSTIFIDYHHWGKYGTGSFRFDERDFPNIPAMLDTLHKKYDTKVVLTVWPCFKPNTENYKEMSDKGYLLDGAKAIDGIIYDTFNPEAAKMYWDKFSALLKYDIDGWFLDGPEPDHVVSFLPTTTYLGSAQRVRNIYPLVHTGHFYEGITQAQPNHRPYVLTRCAWAGQQKYGTAVWSGDIPATFDELRLQVTAGLNFTATGIPYWTTDIGGYLGGNAADEAYRELFTRWFQYGTFCPIFRSHGRRHPGNTTGPNELWAYGKRVQDICTNFIHLRYRLMPYIYTLTAQTTLHGYTPMRLLAFDFANDPKVINCKDEFMYGPAFLVCPVLQAGVTQRQVYLPKGTCWFDFWNNTSYQGGTTLQAAAPLHRIPLYVRAGSIIPYYAKSLKHINSDTSIEVSIYPGSDGQFVLYEDDGTTYDYQKGKYHITLLQWNEQQRTFTIRPVQGKPSKQRTITLRLKGTNSKKEVVKQLKYSDKVMSVSF